VSPRFTSRPYRDSITVGIFPASGEGDVQVLGSFPGPWIVSIEGQWTGLAGFSGWVYARVTQGEIAVLDADLERLRRFTPDGTELPANVLTIHRPPVTPELIAEATSQTMGPGINPEQAKQWRAAQYDPAVLPAHLPFAGVVVDSEGLLWLEEYRIDGAPGKYYILSRDARLAATLVVPPGFRATDIGVDYILGIERDSDDVESVVMYRLRRS
jgi:hypothetical protein